MNHRIKCLSILPYKAKEVLGPRKTKKDANFKKAKTKMSVAS